jgi:fructose-1,6-bisphosphatase I
MTQLVTIERHILEQERQIPHATGVFSGLLYDIALAAKVIARETTRAGLVNIIGAVDSKNMSGEVQQKLDVFADSTLVRINNYTGRLCVMASEEQEEPIPIPDEYPCGRYVLLFDPLDGSANVDVNGTLGTIFAIYRKASSGDRGNLEDVLQLGRQMVAAGYIIFGASTMMVYSAGFGVHGFTLDPSVGEFLLSHENIRIPSKRSYYSVNHGNEKYWTPGVRSYIKWLQGIYGEGSEPIQSRYVGSLIGDFHRNLLRGGVYCYPADLKDPNKPGGKLRLTYEAAPLAYLAEQAGGYASDGTASILDLKPASLHQRVPFFVGNRDLVEQAERFIQEYDQEWLARYMPMREVVSAKTD